MGLEDACVMFSARGQISELGTKLQWLGLFEKAVEESKMGMCITANSIIVVVD